MRKIEMEIVALSHTPTQSHNYAVVLGEKSGNRRLPVVIGAFEAQAIAVAMERMAPNRPLSHDLFKNTLEAFRIQLREIVINNLLDGIFYAQLICEQEGETIEIDSRTSDALALAVRFGCPIYSYEFILDAAGIILEEDDEANPPEPSSTSKKPRRKRKAGPKLDEMSNDDLQKMLEDVLAEEDYERAAKIRDEINRREQGES